MDRPWLIRLLLSVVIAAGGAAALPAVADDFGANEAVVVRRLIPTVVNIVVKKDEAAASTPPPVDATAPGVTSGTSGGTSKQTAPGGANSNGASPEAGSATTVKSYIGSGFVIDPSGLLVTNYHVVQDAFEITVTFSDGTRLAGTLLSASRIADLALLKVEAGHPLPAAHWGDSDALQVGDQVLAAGDPFGIGLSISAGIVSGLNRDIEDSPYDDFIQTDATINHGNSGGPLFNMRGDVVGVDSDIISPTSGSAGIGFAIPSANARFVIDRLRRYGWLNPGWIGVKLQEVTPGLANAMGMTHAEGSLVSWVLAAGPGAKAGVRIGDVILRYDSATPTDARALRRDIVQTPVGKTVTLLLRRGAEELSVRVAVEAWPRDEWQARDAPLAVRHPKIVIPADLGLTLAPLSAGDRAKFGVEGVVVTHVDDNTETAQRGLVSGDVILRVQDKPVSSPAEVQSAIDVARADKREFVMMLVLPKVRTVPKPEWMAFRVSVAGG